MNMPYVKPTVLARSIQTRNTQQHQLDHFSGELQARLAKLDGMIADRAADFANLPVAVRAEIENVVGQVNQIAGDIENIKNDLVDQAKNAQTRTEQSAIANILIRNTESVEIAQAVLKKRQYNTNISFDNVKTRALIGLKNMGDNASYATFDPNKAGTATLHILDSITWGSLSADVVTILRETAYNLMADIIPEGELKPETDMEFKAYSLNAGVIAHFITVSNQVLADMPMLATYLENKLAYGIRYKLEHYVINGHIPKTGETKCFSGLMEDKNSKVVTAAKDDTDLDVLNKAKYEASTSFIEPECYILNPQDWGNIERLKGTDGHYLVGVPTGVGVSVFLWGLPVRFSPAQARGKYWCGNLSLAFDGYIREDVAVEVSLEDGDNFRKNMATVRAEMRATGGVSIPDANVTGSLVSASTTKAGGN